ncbi:hypothetical protein ACWDYJ_26590 [Streptomyces sp. NPDC003042]
MKITRAVALPLIAVSVVVAGGSGAHADEAPRGNSAVLPASQVIPSGLEFQDALLEIVQQLPNGIA